MEPCINSVRKDLFNTLMYLKDLNDLEQSFRLKRVIKKKKISFFNQSYVVGTQKNRLIETVLLGTQNKVTIDR